MTTGRARTLGLNSLLVLLGLALGYAAVVVPGVLADGDDATTRSNPRVGLGDLADSRSPNGASVLTDSGAPEPGGPAAPTPAAAVEQFLAAEVAGDFATSYGFLSAADRDDLGSRAEWTSAHGQLPRITGYTVATVASGMDRTEVATALELDAGLDEIVGLVPARADATWVAVAEDGGWRVAFAQSALTPRYPADFDAPAAVENWVAARRDCRRGDQYRDGLLGSDDLARTLCRAEGRVAAGPVAPLDPSAEAQPFLAAFGPEVFSWARVVPVDAPDPFQVVVAPVDERWLVIGVLDSSPGSSA